MESETAYVSDTVADAPGGGIVAAQLLSHAVLAYAVVFAVRRRELMVGANGLASLFCSLNYHACRGGLVCLGLSLDAWRRADHFTALSLGAALALSLVHYESAGTHGRLVGLFVGYLMPAVVLLAVLAHPFQLQSALIVVVYVALVAVDRFLRTGPSLAPPDARVYKVPSLIAGGLLLLVAVVCYAFDGDSGGRGDSILSGVLHVAWHVLIGAALIAIVDGRSGGSDRNEDAPSADAASLVVNTI
jgi:predicted membrane channel-forming protein YqfA (hemolysin III family)